MSFHRSVIIALGAFCAALGSLLVPVSVAAETPKQESPAALVAEVQRAFTLHGQSIPPEIFRDFGDGDLADSGSIWVTVDLEAAVGSNLYFDPISAHGTWKIQTKQRLTTDTPEQTAYMFCGSTANGLLVVVASYNGGGSGTFHTLHILDVSAGSGLDTEGQRYRRINLTNVRSVILGDRWEGEVKLSNNAVRIITTRNGPADGSARAPVMVMAERP